MCIVLFGIDSHSDYRFIFLSNRDEFLERPSQNCHYWKEHPHVFAGTDMKHDGLICGTWLGMNVYGQLAVITNYREPTNRDQNGTKLSRGILVRDFLARPHLSVQKYLQEVEQKKNDFDGFNLLVGNVANDWSKDNNEFLGFISNRNKQQMGYFEPGIFGMSNGLFNSHEWPKIREGKNMLKECLIKANYENWSEEELIEKLFSILKDSTLYDDYELPYTGIPSLALEKHLSSIFVQPLQPMHLYLPFGSSEYPSNIYGTRTSTVILVKRHSNEAIFIERDINLPDKSLSEYPNLIQLIKELPWREHRERLVFWK